MTENASGYTPAFVDGLVAEIGRLRADLAAERVRNIARRPETGRPMTEADQGALVQFLHDATVEWWKSDSRPLMPYMWPSMCEHIASRILAAGVIVTENERAEIERSWTLFAGCAKEYTGFKAATDKALREARLLRCP